MERQRYIWMRRKRSGATSARKRMAGADDYGMAEAPETARHNPACVRLPASRCVTRCTVWKSGLEKRAISGICDAI